MVAFAKHYDAAGNMISMSKPGSETTRLRVVYDAWNRMVAVKTDAGATIATYEYDGLNRRIEKITTAAAPGGARQVDYYFNENWCPGPGSLYNRREGAASPTE